MRRFRGYLSRIFLLRLLGVTFGVIVLVSLLDSLGNSEMLPADADAVDRLRFTALRLPIIFDSTFPIIVFMSVIVTYLSFIRRNEIVALFSTGLSVFAQFRALAPCLFLVGIGGTLLINATSPPAGRALTEWLGPEVLMPTSTDSEDLWISEPGMLVRAGEFSGGSLRDVTFFMKSDTGQVESVSSAAAVDYGPSGWTVRDSKVIHPENGGIAPPDVWQTPQTPDSLLKLQSYPRYLSLGDLWQLYQLRGSGSRPSGAYMVWIIDRATLPLLALGLLLLGIPVMQRAGRRDTGDIAAVMALGMGFVYLIIDGIFITLAETGVVAGWFGALAPLVLLFMAGAWLALGSERAR